MNGRMYDPAIGIVLSPDNYVQDPTNTQSYNRYSYCMNNLLRYTDPSGWLMAALDEYWNLGKEISDYTSFSGRRASSGDGGCGGGWGGDGGVLPGGIHWMSRDIKIDDLQSLYDVTPSNGKLYTYSNVNGDWYNEYTSSFPEIDAWLNKNALASASNIGYGKSFIDPGDPPGTNSNTVINIWYSTLIGANSKFIPMSTGKDVLIIGLQETPFSFVLTSDAKIGVKSTLDLFNIASIDHTEYFDLMNDGKRSSKSGFSSIFSTNKNSEIWILGLNVSESTNMLIDFFTYPVIVVNQYMKEIQSPQKRYGFN